MSKEKEWEVAYSFQGRGTAIVKAKNKTEAEDKFQDGDVWDDWDSSTGYEIESVEEHK